MAWNEPYTGSSGATAAKDSTSSNATKTPSPSSVTRLFSSRGWGLYITSLRYTHDRMHNFSKLYILQLSPWTSRDKGVAAVLLSGECRVRRRLTPIQQDAP